MSQCSFYKNRCLEVLGCLGSQEWMRVGWCVNPNEVRPLHCFWWRLRSSFKVFCWITYLVSGFFHRHLLLFNHFVTSCWAPLALMCIPSLVLGSINALVRFTRQVSLCLYLAETIRVCRFRAGVADRLCIKWVSEGGPLKRGSLG